MSDISTIIKGKVNDIKEYEQILRLRDILIENKTQINQVTDKNAKIIFNFVQSIVDYILSRKDQKDNKNDVQ